MAAGFREQVDQLFDEAVALPPDQRQLFLAQNCTDPTVCREVESLLAFASTKLEGIGGNQTYRQRRNWA